MRAPDRSSGTERDIMLAGETFRVALGALTANKMRSLLTMLGIIIGIGSVIIMVALGRGAQQQITDRIEAMGTTLLRVGANRVRWGGVGTADIAPLTLEDVAAIRERSRHIVAVQPQQDRDLPVQFSRSNVHVQVTGTSPNYLRVRNYDLAAGRMFSDAENRLMRRVAVLGWTVLEQLGVDNPGAIVGQRIRIQGMQFTVVGVMALKGMAGVRDANEQILIPIRTARYRLFGRERLNDIFVLARNEAAIPFAMAELQQIIRHTHRIGPGDEDDFRIRSQVDFLETLSESTSTFTLLLAGIAGVSLLVGGIGIMNIMLVSVTERIHEIGVRKALGATRRNILLQFLTEAVVICVIGGIIGVSLGLAGAWVLSDAFLWQVAIDPQTAVLAVTWAAGLGILFGVWPAQRAARLDPVGALRHEG
ncbi:MAG TPA: ABC transporter permease [Gemmatimonadaceae bacterium]